MGKGFNQYNHTSVINTIYTASYVVGIYKSIQMQDTSFIQLSPRHMAILAGVYMLRVSGDNNYTIKRLHSFLTDNEIGLDLDIPLFSLYRINASFIKEGLVKKTNHRFEITYKGMKVLNYIEYTKNFALNQYDKLDKL